MQKEINKFLKKINSEKLKRNHKECVELYNIVGGLYSDVGSYDEAIHYHEQALELCKTIGDRLGTAVAFRYIGEAKAALGQFDAAIDFIKKYLDLAERTSNHVEKQRAWTTLGRIYLMQAQDLKDRNNCVDKKVTEIAREAESRFQTALRMADEVSDRIDAKEYAQMKSALLINIGLVKDICGLHEDSVARFRQAIKLCKEAKLKEDLYRCQIILTGVFRQRMKDNDIRLAAAISEEALQTAKSIGKKILICDALIELGYVRLCQKNFKNAKKIFAQAYLEKSPSEEDHAKAIRLTKISHLIYTSHAKFCKDDTPSETKLRLCDKLGDLFVAVNIYKLAIDYYKKALDNAIVCARPKTELARILYSLAETYADDGQYEAALKCYKKELSLRNGNNSEQCQSLIKIAHMHEYLNQEAEQICDTYEKAFEKANNDPKLMHNVLKFYVPYLKQKAIKISRAKQLEDTLLNLKSYPEVIDEVENDDLEDGIDYEDEVANIDDIITDDEDDNEVLMIGKRKARGTTKFKPNEVGDTPLHEASIKGDLKRVKWLIEQGHEVNPRDNAGWIPLHEACNHGHYDIAEFLIKHGADVNNRGLKGMSPLHDAATNGHFDIMRLLMKNGANVIALTDTGETVLSCLRDFKKRNYSDMSNNAATEYKYMEAELLNHMDKCGFNLMSENMKNLGHKSTAGTSALQEEPVRPKPRNVMRAIEKSVTNPVKDYLNTMGTLQRKRLKDDDIQSSEVEKASQPATYQSSMSTSASTKDWLIDDVSKEKQILRRRSNLQDIFDEMSGDEGCDNATQYRDCPVIVEDDDFNDGDDDDVRADKRGQVEEVRIEEDDEVEEVEELVSKTTSSHNISRKRVSSERDSLDDIINPAKRLSQPLVVTIEDRKLLIPIKEEETTIRQLKELIVARYSCLVNSRPKISLTLASDPSCLLFDEDLCKDVIQENVIATVDSWELQSIEDVYVEQCCKLNLEPLTFVKLEMRAFDETSTKLDMKYMRFPKAHLKPVLSALARRDFIAADFTGSSCLFECRSDPKASALAHTITTWGRLTRLSLQCVGLVKAQFESICSGEKKLAQLHWLDVSVNAIAYKSKLEFASHVERLRKACPKLKCLDVRRNHLQFVRPIIRGTSTSSTCNDASVTTPRAEAIGTDKDERLDISEALKDLLSDGIEILASNQSEYAIYST